METWLVHRHGQVAQQGRCGTEIAEDVLVRASLTPSLAPGTDHPLGGMAVGTADPCKSRSDAKAGCTIPASPTEVSGKCLLPRVFCDPIEGSRSIPDENSFSSTEFYLAFCMLSEHARGTRLRPTLNPYPAFCMLSEHARGTLWIYTSPLYAFMACKGLSVH